MTSYVRMTAVIAGRLALYAWMVGTFALFYNIAALFLSATMEKAAAAAAASFLIILALDRLYRARVSAAWDARRGARRSPG